MSAWPVFTPSRTERAQNVGIHAIEVYVPKRAVDETALEQFDGVSAGKYTIGLGQERMAFVDDREDIGSFLLSAVSGLLTKYNIPTDAIGRLEVGTETLVDKSKAVKTTLMQLFGDNTDIEGIDSKNACYGGTAAVFNTINWIESSSWDGRYGIVACGDVALYEAGSGRPVGGAGAVALLIGPDAPVVFEPIHGTFMANVYDFYKPKTSSEYPTVDGPLTQTCYPNSLDHAYDAYRRKQSKFLGKSGALSDVTADDFDYMAFHSPYGKLVQKGFARLYYNDFLANPKDPKFAGIDPELATLDRESNILNKTLEKTFIGLTKDAFAAKTVPTNLTSKRLGNIYTGSLWGCVASLFANVDSATLQNKRISLYSYGSGLSASFFAATVKGSTEHIQKALNLVERLDAVTVASPEEYLAAVTLREKAIASHAFTPEGSIDNIWPGAYYLVSVDEQQRRTYAQK